MRQGVPSQSILSSDRNARIVVGNWIVNSPKDGTLHINNSEGHQVSFKLINQKKEVS